MDVFRGFRPSEPDNWPVYRHDPVGVVFGGRKLTSGQMALAYHDEEDEDDFWAQFEEFRDDVAEYGPENARFIAFLSANMDVTPRAEVQRNIDAFSKIFPGVPVMGNLDRDTRRISPQFHPRFSMLILVIG